MTEILKFENGFACATAVVVDVVVDVADVAVVAPAWAGTAKGAAARPPIKNRLKLLRM
ncbi:MAG: hypothetical protein HOV86_04645 [Thermoactinospora sp.]|nr:hypothetical protein [Thermoactinospora sp.]